MDNNKTFSHHLAVIVPFRDRFDELVAFVPHLHQFLKNQNVGHEIFIVNQVPNISRFPIITILTNVNLF